MKIPDEFSSSVSDADMPSTSSGPKLGASPAIDRHNPIILSDSRRPNPPTPRHEVLKSVKNGSDSLQMLKTVNDQKEKSVMKSYTSSGDDKNLFSPPESSRYLLGESILSDALSDLYPALESFRGENKEILDLETDEKASSKFSDSNKSRLPCNKKSEQIVVLRVSLHCKGCAAKVRKHISRMKGVTSFNIDFAAKKVTVVGDVTPLTVLATISKVKNAQLWTNDNPILSRITEI